jgi:hypothetical protein
VQALMSVAPTTGEYFPASQLTQLELPVGCLYVPALQSVHAEEPVTLAYLPELQLVHEPLAPSWAWKRPTAQGVQNAWPEPREKVPALHGEHMAAPLAA